MTGTATERRRADGGTVRLGQRDIDGLILCAEHGGAPYDLLAAALGAQPARLRGIVARWRRAGYAATGSLGPGPAWCWLTPAGMTAAGLPYPAARPPLARLAHTRAVLAARLWFTASPAWDQHQAWWQSERRIRRKGPAAGTHRPDAEIWWPSIAASPYAGQIWAIEIELTAKHAARTAAIMADLAAPAGYARVIYLTAPAARGVVARCADALPPARHPRPGDGLGPAPVRLHPGPRINGIRPLSRRNGNGEVAVTAVNGTGEDPVNRGDKPSGMVKGPRIISYNLDEDERPGGMKIRFKVRVETGRKAAVWDKRQAEAIRELLQWVRQHRSSSGPGEPPAGTPPAR